MRLIMNLLLILSVLGPTANAYALARAGVVDASALTRFAATGGRFETIDGRPIDPAQVDADSLRAFVVRPGGSTRRVLIEQINGNVQVTVLDDQNQALMKRTLAAPSERFVQLAAATEEEKSKDEGAQVLMGLGAFVLGITCLGGLGTCPWVAAVIITYFAIQEFERYDQRHHPAPDAKPAKP